MRRFSLDWRCLTRTPFRRRALALSAHLLLTAAAYWAAFVLRHDLTLPLPSRATARFVETVPYLLLVRAVFLHRFGLDRGYWRHVGLRDLLQLMAATALGSLAFPVLLLVTHELHGIPASVFVLEWLLAVALGSGVRILARGVSEQMHRVSPAPGKRALIVGAGAAGEQLVRQILHDPGRHPFQLVGLVDDDPSKHGRSLHGIPVLGDTEQLPGFVALHRVRVLLIAMPSAAVEQLRRVVDRCAASGAEFKTLPPLEDVVTQDVQLKQMREVQIEDLLGREPVRLDLKRAEQDLAGKVVLITGAGGSIGSELARQIARFHPLRLILLERAESPLYFTHREVSEAHPETHVVPVLGSVTNGERLREVFERHRPDYVVHAAAYKHVPMLEWNMAEGVWNNVIGTLRLARCAAEFGTAKFVMISTDKAVNPTCVLGATKRLAERVVMELPALRTSETDFRVVRFGNVLGSDGSVVPLFKRQLAAGGPLTVTHPEVRRYFMTISEAVQLVLEAAAMPEAANRIALLEMGSQVKILDLAEQMIRLAGLQPYQDIRIAFTGLRPGEKIEEELLAGNESAAPTALEKIRLVERNGAHGEELARQLRALIAVAARRDEAALMRALTALVPEYQPDTFGPLWSIAIPGRNGRNGKNGNGKHGNGKNGNGNGNGNGKHGNGKELVAVSAPALALPRSDISLVATAAPRPLTSRRAGRV